MVRLPSSMKYLVGRGGRDACPYAPSGPTTFYHLCSAPFPSLSCQNLLPQSSSTPPMEEARRSRHSAFPTLSPSTEPWLGLGPHLSLSPSSWRFRPSLCQVMLCCKEGSKEAWQVNITLEPFFLIVLWGPCVI